VQDISQDLFAADFLPQRLTRSKTAKTPSPPPDHDDDDEYCDDKVDEEEQWAQEEETEQRRVGFVVFLICSHSFFVLWHWCCLMSMYSATPFVRANRSRHDCDD
jgi:hypothetical protein